MDSPAVAPALPLLEAAAFVAPDRIPVSLLAAAAGLDEAAAAAAVRRWWHARSCHTNQMPRAS